MPLASCAWLECLALCEGFYAQAMTNPKTGAHIACGNFVQKSDLTKQQREEMDACVVTHIAQGFVLDKPAH